MSTLTLPIYYHVSVYEEDVLLQDVIIFINK